MSIDFVTATHKDFEKFVGQTFFAETTGGGLELTLDEITVHSEAHMRDNHLELQGVVYPPRRAFTLTFKGPAEVRLEQGTFLLKTNKKEELTMFLSPFRQEPDGWLYESVFS